MCLGTDFGAMIESLANGTTPHATAPRCDVGASSITQTTKRARAGIEFADVATYRNSLRALVVASIEERGMWAFFQPLHYSVWVALVITVVVVPFFVFLFEFLFSSRCVTAAPFGAITPASCAELDAVLLLRRCIYTAGTDDGNLHLLRNLKEALWHSIAHTLSIDVFRVHTLAARIVTMAYCFMVRSFSRLCAGSHFDVHPDWCWALQDLCTSGLLLQLRSVVNGHQ